MPTRWREQAGHPGKIAAGSGGKGQNAACTPCFGCCALAKAVGVSNYITAVNAINERHAAVSAYIGTSFLNVATCYTLAQLIERANLVLNAGTATYGTCWTLDEQSDWVSAISPAWAASAAWCHTLWPSGITFNNFVFGNLPRALGQPAVNLLPTYATRIPDLSPSASFGDLVSTLQAMSKFAGNPLDGTYFQGIQRANPPSFGYPFTYVSEAPFFGAFWGTTQYNSTTIFGDRSSVNGVANLAARVMAKESSKEVWAARFVLEEPSGLTTATVPYSTGIASLDPQDAASFLPYTPLEFRHTAAVVVTSFDFDYLA